jgi:hypothetical protein
MADDPQLLEELEKAIAAAQEAAAFQGDTVRSLKALAKDGKAEKVSAKYQAFGIAFAVVLLCCCRRFAFLRSRARAPFYPLHHPHTQADVEAAIAKLAELKLVLDEKQKVR